MLATLCKVQIKCFVYRSMYLYVKGNTNLFHVSVLFLYPLKKFFRGFLVVQKWDIGVKKVNTGVKKVNAWVQFTAISLL